MKVFGFNFVRAVYGKNPWRYWRPRRLTLPCHPAIYRWLFWNFTLPGFDRDIVGR